MLHCYREAGVELEQDQRVIGRRGEREERDQVSQRQLDSRLAVDQEHGNVRDSDPVRYRSEVIVGTERESGESVSQSGSARRRCCWGPGGGISRVGHKRRRGVSLGVEGESVCLVVFLFSFFFLVERPKDDTRKERRRRGRAKGDGRVRCDRRGQRWTGELNMGATWEKDPESQATSGGFRDFFWDGKGGR